MSDFASALYPDPTPEPGNTAIATGAISAAQPPTNDSRLSSAASTLYGDPEPSAPAPVQENDEHPIDRNNRQEKALYADEQPVKLDVPEAIKELRNSPERLLAGDNLGNSINQEYFNEAIPDQKLAKAVAQESKAILSDLGFTQTEVSQLGMAITELNRVGEITPQAREQLRSQATDTLIREHGDRADQVYKDIVKLVNRDQRFARFLNDSNLGDSPRMASILGQLAVKARNSGQIK